MSTQVAKQISVRMKAKNLSVQSLEKKAGLKTHAVRNIIRGKSKRPSGEILQAISDVFGCTVEDLLHNQEIFQEEYFSVSKSELIIGHYDFPDLYSETVTFVNEVLKNKGIEVSIKQAFTCIEEIYLYSSKKDSRKVDKDLGDLWINLVTG
jgi:transcriptional regulator with XRE-family HTH domain